VQEDPGGDEHHAAASGRAPRPAQEDPVGGREGLGALLRHPGVDQYASSSRSAGSRRPRGENTSSRALLNGTGVSSAPSRATGASSQSKPSWAINAASSAPNPPVVGASCRTSPRPVLRTEASTVSRS